VARIKELAREGAYDGVVFHRVIDGFMAQTGDVQLRQVDRMLRSTRARAGMGGSDKPDLKAGILEHEPHVRGTCSMARSQNPNSANSASSSSASMTPAFLEPPIYGLGQGHRGHGKRRQASSAGNPCASPTGSPRCRSQPTPRDMKALSAAVLLLASMALPAHATEWMDCSDPTDSISFRVLLGAMEVIAVNTIEIEAQGRKWSTAGGEGAIPITTGQAFETAEQMWIDVTDEAVNLIVARLRLFKAVDDGGEGDATMVLGGTLAMPGVGAWPVSCSGP
jgi:hypothetical protein